MKLKEVPAPDLLQRAYRGPNGLFVIASREHGIWHISASTPDRYPTWDELRDVCWALKPGLSFSITVPYKDSPYVNFHEHCIHLWEEKS